MNFNDLSPLFDEDIRILSTDEDMAELKTGEEVVLHPSLQNKEVLIKQNDTVVGFELSEADGWCTSSDNSLWLLREVKGRSVRLQGMKISPVNQNFTTNLNVAVDEKIRDEVATKAAFTNPSIDEVSQWLSEEFVLSDLSGDRILQASYRADEISSEATTINLVGRNFMLVLDITADGALWIRRLAPLSRNRKFSISVVPIGLIFSDATIAARLANPEEVDKLKSLRRDHSSYIALWEEYNRIADMRARDKARNVGYVRYVKHDKAVTADRIEWRFYFKNEDFERVNDFCESLKETDGSKLELHKDLPRWLDNKESTDQFADGEYESRLKANLLSKTNQYLVLDLEQGAKPTNTGVIYLSLAGVEVMSKRRKTARDDINNQRNGMAQLCHLVEGLPVETARFRTIKPLSPAAKECFKGEPTDKQVEALDKALNTPDIALILGPPGTGKTQIISAIQRRLAEEAKTDISKDVLVSSFQHDAVDNVVARSDVFGLPAIRVGKRDRSSAILQQWIKKQQTNLEAVVASEKSGSGGYILIEKIRRDIAVLLNGGLSEEDLKNRISSLASSLDELGEMHELVISSSLKAKLKNASISISERTRSTDVRSSDSLMRKVRGLRVARNSFEDDGPDRAFDCIAAIKLSGLKLEEGDQNLLADMADSYAPPSELDIKKLAELRGRLIERLLPDYRPRALRTSLGNDFEKTLKAISSELTGQLASSSAGITDILNDYNLSLSYQKGRIRETIEDYTTTLGATCQGAVSNEMLNTLSALGQDDISFDSVIIDEAARANPLDLFIPMSLARRRIILVGDHYQLPQMLEPDIENEMKEKGTLSEDFSSALSESLFERLYVQLKEREQQDGFKRTVMLDKQFRMHPDIGQFVSKNFYENNGEPPVEAGLKESDFSIDLPEYAGSVAHWVDVPYSKGGEKRAGTSWVRWSEVDQVAEIATGIVNSNRDISVGVITFYAPQREAIFSSLQEKGICRRSEDGWEYEAEYISTSQGEERIRVGSVDAFQGKEFDVVILSMTRSNKHAGLEEVQLNKKYGFLRLPNRLNVAFSRAKNLLIAVGDREMFSGEEAKAAMPSVYEYSNTLCGDNK